jgi:hypothetical protein
MQITNRFANKCALPQPNQTQRSAVAVSHIVIVSMNANGSAVASHRQRRRSAKSAEECFHR